MKVLKLALCAAAASLLTAGAAAAEAPTVAWNLGVASDYVFRGISQTDENPEVFGGVDLTQGIFYAGAWTSNVDFGDSTDAEVDLYGGVTPTLGPVSLNLGAIYYGYVNAPDDADWAYWELKAAGSVPVGPATVGAAFYYSPEYTGHTGEALYSELNGSYAPMDKLTLSGAYGHQALEDTDGYNTWNAGATYAFTDHISGDLRYSDTDIDACDICGERVYATLKATF